MFQANCYVITCPKTKEGIIIDPGFDNEIEAEKIFRFIEKNELRLRYIVNTHGHPDHTCGNGFVKGKFDTPIMIHKNDAHLLGASAQAIAEALGFKTHSPEADILLEDGNSQVWASKFESHAHSRPQPRKHITRGRERSIHGRHAVCRLHRKNRFPRKLQPANAAITAEAESPTRSLRCLFWTRVSHDNRRRKTQQPVHASNVITARP